MHKIVLMSWTALVLSGCISTSLCSVQVHLLIMLLCQEQSNKGSQSTGGWGNGRREGKQQQQKAQDPTVMVSPTSWFCTVLPARSWMGESFIAVWLSSSFLGFVPHPSFHPPTPTPTPFVDNDSRAKPGKLSSFFLKETFSLWRALHIQRFVSHSRVIPQLKGYKFQSFSYCCPGLWKIWINLHLNPWSWISKLVTSPPRETSFNSLFCQLWQSWCICFSLSDYF